MKRLVSGVAGLCVIGQWKRSDLSLVQFLDRLKDISVKNYDIFCHRCLSAFRLVALDIKRLAVLARWFSSCACARSQIVQLKHRNVLRTESRSAEMC